MFDHAPLYRRESGRKYCKKLKKIHGVSNYLVVGELMDPRPFIQLLYTSTLQIPPFLPNPHYAM